MRALCFSVVERNRIFFSFLTPSYPWVSLIPFCTDFPQIRLRFEWNISIHTLPYRSDYLVMLSTMDLQSRLSLASWSTLVVVWPPSRKPRMLSMYFLRCLPLALVPSILPSRQSLSSSSALTLGTSAVFFLLSS